MNEEFKTGMVIDETMKADLLSSAKWAKFLLVLQTIGVAIAAINAQMVPSVIATTKVPTISKVKNL